MNQKIPKHVAIVMDGNGRWAKNRGLQRTEGHRIGVDVVKTVVKACIEKNIPILSLWAFGSENWSRPVEEVDFLMQLFLQSLESEHQELNQNGVRLYFTGDRAPLSDALRKQMLHAEKLTENNQRLILNVLINYGGKWDILQAAKQLASDLQRQVVACNDITEDYFASLLSMRDLPDPDLFIRTSGEQRLSNFFLWQLAYAELYFSEVHWPDFTVSEFEKALESYSSRERRYGQTSQQLAQTEANIHV